MPKFARPNAYNGRQSTKDWTGSTRAATISEVAAGVSENLYVSPATMGEFLEFSLTAPGPIGSVVPNTGAFTTLNSTGDTRLATVAASPIRLGNTTGTVGFFGSAGTARVSQAALTNALTVSGTASTISNYAIVDYATDAPAIRGNIYQLSLALTNIIGALRGYGLLN